MERHDSPQERRWIGRAILVRPEDLVLVPLEDLVLVRPEDLSPCGKKIGSRDQGGAVHGKLPAPC